MTDRRTLKIPLELAQIIAKVFLPANPLKMRKADQAVILAALDFKARVAAALKSDAGA